MVHKYKSVVLCARVTVDERSEKQMQGKNRKEIHLKPIINFPFLSFLSFFGLAHVGGRFLPLIFVHTVFHLHFYSQVFILDGLI